MLFWLQNEVVWLRERSSVQTGSRPGLCLQGSQQQAASENSALRSDLYDGEAPVSANGLANDLDPVFELRRHPSSQHHAAKLPPLVHPISVLFSCIMPPMLTASVPRVAGRLGSNRWSDWRRRGPRSARRARDKEGEGTSTGVRGWEEVGGSASRCSVSSCGHLTAACMFELASQ